MNKSITTHTNTHTHTHTQKHTHTPYTSTMVTKFVSLYLLFFSPKNTVIVCCAP